MNVAALCNEIMHAASRLGVDFTHACSDYNSTYARVTFTHGELSYLMTFDGLGRSYGRIKLRARGYRKRDRVYKWRKNGYDTTRIAMALVEWVTDAQESSARIKTRDRTAKINQRAGHTLFGQIIERVRMRGYEVSFEPDTQQEGKGRISVRASCTGTLEELHRFIYTLENGR